MKDWTNSSVWANIISSEKIKRNKDYINTNRSNNNKKNNKNLFSDKVFNDVFTADLFIATTNEDSMHKNQNLTTIKHDNSKIEDDPLFS